MKTNRSKHVIALNYFQNDIVLVCGMCCSTVAHVTNRSSSDRTQCAIYQRMKLPKIKHAQSRTPRDILRNYKIESIKFPSDTNESRDQTHPFFYSKSKIIHYRLHHPVHFHTNKWNDGNRDAL